MVQDRKLSKMDKSRYKHFKKAYADAATSVEKSNS